MLRTLLERLKFRPFPLFYNWPHLDAITYMYFCGVTDAIGVFMKYDFWFTYAIDSFYFITPFHES